MEEWEKRAHAFARQKHASEIDDDGKTPYFESHILKVVAIIKCVTDDRDLITAAYLHDTIEDAHVSLDEIANTFGGRVAKIVYEVTHEGTGRDNYYFPRLKSREAAMLKFADRLSNISRMDKAWPKEKQADYLKRSVFWKTEAPKA